LHSQASGSATQVFHVKLNKAKRVHQLAERPNVLCLGMSFPQVPSRTSVEGAKWRVATGVLSPADGRDLARLRCMEQNFGVAAYTVSLQAHKKEGVITYNPKRHLTSNFNNRKFFEDLKMTFGDDIRFRFIFLDYFYCPPQWVNKNWSENFFSNTLPGFAKVMEKRKEHTSSIQSNNSATIFLPFCKGTVEEISGAPKQTIEKFFKISLLQKEQLNDHLLWQATQKIGPNVMRNWFEKELNQEELYCKLNIQHLSQRAHTWIESFTKDPSNVRMIRLTKR